MAVTFTGYKPDDVYQLSRSGRFTDLEELEKVNKN